MATPSTQTASALKPIDQTALQFLKVLDQIYVVSPLQPPPSPTATG